MKDTIGIIGCGNMATAIIGGMVESKLFHPDSIMVSDLNSEKLNNMQNKYKIKISNDNKQVTSFAQILILAIKPYIHNRVLSEIKPFIKKDTIIVTIAAGIDMAYIEESLGSQTKVIRTMPNTPALVKKGMSVICHNKNITETELNTVVKIFQSFGKVEIIEEKLMDYIPAISGSSPAYVFMFIEALADGAVASGIPRDKAYKMAASTVLGAAQMVLETGKHPGELKDMVCTPGGTTIEAVMALEKNGFRNAVLEAMKACNKKGLELLKNK